MKQMKQILIRLFVLVLVAEVSFFIGHGEGAQSERLKAKGVEADQLRKVFEQGQALGTVRDQVVTKYVDRVEYIEKRGATIIKEVPVYVSAKSDAACVVPTGFVRLHDAAATGADLPPPGRAGAADESPSGIALSAVASTTAANYAACNANAEQLSQLQTFLQAHEQVLKGGGQAHADH